MGDVEILRSHRLRRSQEIVGDIVYVLRCMGGAAHMNVLASAVEAKIRSEKRDNSINIVADIQAALNAFDLDNSERTTAPFFNRPFGVHSHRWALLQPPVQSTYEFNAYGTAD